MPLSEDPTIGELIQKLDFKHICVRCGKPFPEISAIITPWTITLPGGGTGCVGAYLTFLCLACRAQNESAAPDIIRLESDSESEVIEDLDAFK